MKFDIGELFENLSRKFQVTLKSDNNNKYFSWRRMYIYDGICQDSRWYGRDLNQALTEYKPQVLMLEITCSVRSQIWKMLEAMTAAQLKQVTKKNW
jgi:hypothetical protein